eukprot:9522532-Alexandrium_andersonii.AAC.1
MLRAGLQWTWLHAARTLRLDAPAPAPQFRAKKRVRARVRACARACARGVFHRGAASPGCCLPCLARWAAGLLYPLAGCSPYPGLLRLFLVSLVWRGGSTSADLPPREVAFSA